ncbi:unnamed protein product [Schistocephalus solidus]|uniref:Uncharacterized protein n=1 Tax=Schistocephalus solidus TaxID=70667 RepID=A0A183STU9_SCHSO|nr:unnamed protein product [Schistocephalus solidus]
MFSALLMDAYRDESPGICIAYLMDGQLLYQWRMHFHSSVSTDTIHELLFAGNCALNATTEGTMQRSMDRFAAACNNFRLRINSRRSIPPTTHLTSMSTVLGGNPWKHSQLLFRHGGEPSN